MSEAVHSATSGGRRAWLFRMVAVLLPLAFFSLAEAGLRLADYGYNFALFRPLPGREGILFPNPDLGRLYFRQDPPPNILADFFPASRAESDVFVVVQGASSAAGFPYHYGGTFPHILENRLRRAYPSSRVDVVNTSMAAVNSYTLLDLAPQIANLRPDAVLIYAGHNEYYGALGVASTENIRGSGRLVRIYLRLMRFRFVQLLRHLLTRSSGGGADEGRMAQLAGEQSIELDSETYLEGLEQLRSNLSAILALYRKHEVPVFVATVASNVRNQAPLIRHSEADRTYRTARRLDSLGRFDEAAPLYVKAKDLDPLRFRAPEAMNEVIRRTAEREGATVVEVHRTLEQRSSDGIIGSDLMVDHLHPNLRGYHLIADAFFDSLVAAHERMPHPPAETLPSRVDVVLTEVDSLVGMFHLRQLMAKWPFSEGPFRLEPPRNPVEQLAVDVFSGRLSWAEANRRAIGHYMRTRDYPAALRAARSRMQELPFLAEPYLLAAGIQLEMNLNADAVETLRQAIALEATWHAHAMLATALARLGDRDESLEHLRRAQAIRSR